MNSSGNDTEYDASPSNRVGRSNMSRISHLRLKMMKKPPSKTKVKTANAVRDYFVPILVIVASSMLLWAWMYLFQSRLLAAQALTALEHGQSEAALEMFRKSISCNPHNAPAHFYCGLICERNGKLAAALDYFNESARLASGNADVLDRQASVAIKLERYQLATSVYKKLFAIKSFVPASQQIRNQAYAQEYLGKYNEALVGYVVSLKLDANNPTAIKGIARCQMAQGQYDKAVENLNKLIKADKSDVSALLLRGWSYKNLGFNGMAHSDLDAAIHEAPSSAETHLYKARFMDSLGDRNEALKEFAVAVAVEPANMKARKERALYLLSLKHYEEALSEFAKLSSSDENLYTQVTHARKAVALGAPNALNLVNEVITSHPHYAAMYLERATCMAKQSNLKVAGNIESAIADCNKALAMEPNSIAALLKRAQINAIAGNTTDSIRDFEAVVASTHSAVAHNVSTNNFGADSVGANSVGANSVGANNVGANNVAAIRLAAYLGLGSQQLQLSRHSNALRNFRKASQIQPGNAEAIAGIKAASSLLLSAAKNNRENRIAEEISETELAEIEQADFSCLLEKSYAALKSHRVPRAIRALRRAIQLDANSVLARRYLATALLADCRPQEADEQFSLLEQLGESRTASDDLKLAKCYVDANAPRRATEILSKYIEKHPHDVNATVLLSHAYASCGNTQRALEVCNNAMASANSRDTLKLQKEILSLQNTKPSDLSDANDPNAYEKEAHDVAAMDFRS